MAGLIPKDIVERIKNESDIVAVISEFVNLKKSGKDYKGLCPFHQEKTPSFYVVPGRGFYHCFGCSQGGNVINFVMEHERFDYPGALRYLAAKAGITIPQTGDSRSDGDRLYNALSLAAGYFESSLWGKSSETAIKYLKSRKIEKSIAQMYGIGFAPPGWDGLIKAASSKGIKPSDLERAGLAIKKEGYYDRFRNRLMIPIRTIAGRVVGFGGRVLPGDDSPKYINSPETEVYKKGRILFGLDISKNDVRAKNEAVVVEGYFDLITLNQSGITNAVAASGTGFTVEQAALLARFCERVVLLYDSDSAGIKAAFRACGILYNSGLEPRLVKLPKGFDPDSFVRENGAERLSGLIKEANDILDFVQQFIKGRFADQPLSKQKKIINKLTELLEPIDDGLTRNLLSKKMFEKIDIDSKTLGILSERRTTALPGSDVPLSPTRDRVERKFLAILLMHPEQISKAEKVVEESLFTEESNARIFAAITKFHTEGKDFDISELSEEVGGNGASRCLREIAIQELSTPDWELEFEGYLKKFRLISIGKRLDELKGLIGEAERMSDQNKIEILTREFQNLKLEVEANDARV
jgi:DNA primase